MNIVDVVIVVALLAALILGYLRGLVSQLVSVLGLFLACFAAYRFSGDLSPYLAGWLPLNTFAEYGKYEFAVRTLRMDEYVLHALSFVLIFAAVKVGLTIAGSLLNLVSKVPGLNAANRWGGALLALVEAAVIAVVLVYGLSFVPSDPVQRALAASKSVPYIMDTVPKVLGGWREPKPEDIPAPQDAPVEAGLSVQTG